MHVVDERASYFGRLDVNQSIIDRFASVVRRHGDRLAVKEWSLSISYADLDQWSNGIALNICQNVGRRPEPIALLFPQSAASVASIFGVLKSGNFYVSLNPQDRLEHLGQLLAEAGCQLVVTDYRCVNLARALSNRYGMRLVNVDEISGAKSGDLPCPRPDDAAYIFFTSGSSGRPKGVVDVHKAVLHNVMRYTNALGFTANDRMTVVQAPSYSGTVSTIFGALMNGAAVLPFDMQKNGAYRIRGWIERERITIYHSTPALFRAVFADGCDARSLRLVRLEGDRATAGDMKLLRSFASRPRLVNGLGTTETGLVCKYEAVPGARPARGVLPVGVAVDDMEVCVLDSDGCELPHGVAGEIAVASPYLACGYWRDPELTASRFVERPGRGRMYLTGDRGRICDDGCLELIGRCGRQVRIRGRTIDLADLESSLLNIEGIHDAIVSPRLVGDSEDALEAFVVCTDNLSAADIRTALRRAVPDHCVPATITVVDYLPTTAGGKVDRRLLVVRDNGIPTGPKVPSGTRTRSENKTEAKLQEIWHSTLRMHVGIDDDFFALGGDSLTAIQIVKKIERAFNVKVHADLLTVAPTIKEVAERLRNEASVVSEHCLLSFRRGTSQRSLFCFHTGNGSGSFYGAVAHHLRSDVTVRAIVLPDHFDESLPYTDFPLLATRHVETILRIQPTGPYYLVGNCLGCLVAFEVAVQLEARGRRVMLLALTDDTLPAHRPQVRHPRVKTANRMPGPPETGTPRRKNVGIAIKLTRLLRRARRRWLQIADRGYRERARIRDALMEGRRKYAPGVLNTGIVLIRSSQSPEFNEKHRLVWDKLTTDSVQCRTFFGEHNNMFRAPFVQSVASILDDCIEARDTT